MLNFRVASLMLISATTIWWRLALVGALTWTSKWRCSATADRACSCVRLRLCVSLEELLHILENGLTVSTETVVQALLSQHTRTDFLLSTSWWARCLWRPIQVTGTSEWAPWSLVLRNRWIIITNNFWWLHQGCTDRVILILVKQVWLVWWFLYMLGWWIHLPCVHNIARLIELNHRVRSLFASLANEAAFQSFCQVMQLMILQWLVLLSWLDLSYDFILWLGLRLMSYVTHVVCNQSIRRNVEVCLHAKVCVH